MKEKIPRTPFSTPLSGSAREVELRLKNIFSGPKKRPPALFLALVFAMCIFCGNLVSCQVAEAERETPDPAANGSEPPAASQPEENVNRIEAGPSQAWAPVELKNSIVPDCLVDEPYAGFTREETALLEDIPPDVAEQLPRQAVDPHRARRQDYWHDMLLPVAYDEAEDVTIYFVVVPSSMPDIEPGASPDLYALERRGIVIRRGSFAYYGDLAWYTNAHFSSAPLFYAGDLDGEEGDTDPEAALALAWGSGTGCYVESLYVIDLDYFNMCYITPDYSSLPLEITVSPDGKTARLVSGEKELDVDLTQLVEPFKGTVEVGSQVRFEEKDGQIFCDLELDFSCMTLEYLASVRFPVIFEDGAYKLGPAVRMDSFV